jgi:hypothetical protein
LVDQNSSLKKEAGIAERKLLARNERIQNLEALLQDADRRLAVQNQKFEAQLQAVKDRLEQARCEWTLISICLADRMKTADDGTDWIGNGSQLKGLRTHLRSISVALRNRFGVGVEGDQEQRHQAGTTARILWHGCKGTMVEHPVRMKFTLAFIVLHKRVWCVC